MERERIGKYEIVEKLGEGSFGVVFRGRDPDLKREVAIKLCSVEDDGLRKRFVREGQISGNLQHKNIVTVFSAENDEEGVPFLVQEYLPGEDLDAMVKRREALSPQLKIGFLLQIARGLAHAHAQGVIHRDIKPANIRRLEDESVKIMDFGIAKLASAETQLTQKGVTMGTASYLPPEQVRGSDLDHRADIFSFGVLAYEILTYERPFRGNTLSALVYQILYKVPLPMNALWSDCPEALSDLVARCLEKKPERRFASFDEVIPLLTNIAEDIDRGRWPTLREVSMISPPPAPDNDEEPILSETAIARTAGDLERGFGEATVARGSAASIAPTVFPSMNPSDPEATQLIGSGDLAPTGDVLPSISGPLSSGPIAETAAPPGDFPGLSLATAPTQVIPRPDLAVTAEKVSALIAQGDLHAAKRQLEESIATLTPAKALDPSSQAALQTPPPETTLKEVASQEPPAAPVTSPIHASEQHRPGRKPGSASDLLAEIAAERQAAGEALKAPPTPPPTPAGRRAASRRAAGDSGSFMTILTSLPPWQRWLAAAAAVLFIVGVASVLLGPPEKDAPPTATPAPDDPVTTQPIDPSVPTGAVLVAALPWGEVSEITDADGYVQPLPPNPFTPLRLDLPAGNYVVHLRRPDVSDVATCEIVVTVGDVVRCDADFGREDTVTDYFKESGWWR